MSGSPETRASLLVRLKDRADQEAWSEFVEIYQPAIYRLARHNGLQHADAEDLAQRVLMAITRAIERWEQNPQRARFRTWLHRVAENAIMNALSRAKADRGSGDSDLLAWLDQQPAPTGPDSDLLRLEYRRELFRWAARQIRAEFRSDTWEAFWLSAVEGLSVEQTARRLSKTRGAVYAARSRVIRRLREKVQERLDEWQSV
ncbi:MAG: sigma-70 family RNA polymerase sigma factor [Planctomycetes bacterium]|nr:sigma-70 family RNA polymerase sigma factor [Planctomycetota bacterium]